MLDDLAGKRTGERIQILRERRGLSRPVLAGLVGMSASWLKGIERGTRLPPRLPLLVKLAEALAVGDVAVLAARTADAWLLWHQSAQHRTDMGRILPRLVTDARIAARVAEDRRAAGAVLADVYALVQHEVVWASEAELNWTAADRAMSAAQDADTPAALAGAAWTLGMMQCSAGDTDGALTLAQEAADLLDRALKTPTMSCAGCTARSSSTPRPRRPGPGARACLAALGRGQRHRSTAAGSLPPPMDHVRRGQCQAARRVDRR